MGCVIAPPSYPTYTAQAVGHRGRTVRLNGGKVPLATATYNHSHSQDDQTKEQVAARIAALWNLAKGSSTADIEALVDNGITLSKMVSMALENHSEHASGTPRAGQQ